MYLAIAMLIAGYRFNCSTLIDISGGIFLGLAFVHVLQLWGE